MWHVKESKMEKTDVTQYKVAVLAGGWSDEREISLQSGKACEKALRNAGFKDVDFWTWRPTTS